MRAFLAVSYAPDRSAHPEPDPRAIAVLARQSTLAPNLTAQLRQVEGGWVAMVAPELDDVVNAPGGGFTIRLGRAMRSPAADLSSTAVGRLLGDGTAMDGPALAAVLPPFAAVHCERAGQPIVAATDWLGFRQLFWWQGDGVAAVSTSALALGVVAGARRNMAALGLQSLVGWQVGLDTVFDGVGKVPDGSAAVLNAGRVDVRRYIGQSLRLDAVLPVADVVDEMASTLREFHARYLADYPATVLQLTGGQDTRVLLSAVPPAARSGLPALTVDVRGGSDAAFAARLSAVCGLDHQVHWLDDQPAITPSRAYALAVEAAEALDAMASPLALAPLLLAESQLEQGHRLSGLGGEAARGFYYFGQPRQAQTSPRLVDQLARWRLFANEAVATEALEPEFVESARRDALAGISAGFDGTSTQWLRATDEFYVFQRMQRWGGAHGSVAAANRFFINPMFARRFVQLAHHVDPTDKRGGRLTGMLISALDPQLAAIPLDSGLVPARLGTSGLRTRAAAARVVAVKAAGKVRQRLRRAGRPQLGAAEFAALVVAHWRAEPDAIAGLRDTGLVRSLWLDGLLSGQHEASAATVAFLTNLLVADVTRA